MQTSNKRGKSPVNSYLLNWKWRDMCPSMDVWPILWNRALHLPILSAHTQQWTHTHTHTPGAVGSHLCCGIQGVFGGSVPCSRALQSWYWGWRERCTFTPPHLQSPPAPDSNPQPLDYKSDSVTIRPWLPPSICFYVIFMCFTFVNVVFTKSILLPKRHQWGTHTTRADGSC